MLNSLRFPTYDRGYPDSRPWPRLTPRQVKRVSHKRMSRKTHEHSYMMTLKGRRKVNPDGTRFRCLRCRPLPWREPTGVKAAEGPRDWTPPGKP